MTYRCRGELNGRGTIIRGPTRKPLFERKSSMSIDVENPDHNIAAENEFQLAGLYEQQPHSQMTQPSSTSTPSPANISTATLLNATPSHANTSTSTTPNVDMTPITHTDLDQQSMIISDETGNPAKVDAVLERGGLWWV